MKDEFYLRIAEELSKESKCLKGKFGAVVVKNDIILGTGYNGPARGVKHCKVCRRNNSKPGEGYEKCIAVHAEENALINSGGRDRCIEGTMYLASCNRTEGKYNKGLSKFFPCNRCARLLINAGIKEVVLYAEGAVRKYEIKPLVQAKMLQ